MSKPLTAAAVAKLKPGTDRIETPDAGCPGLYLVVQPSGAKSWALRYRRPGGKPAKLVLGSVHIRNGTDREPDIEPIIGGHLTLAAAHALVAKLRHQIKQNRDPAAEHLAERQRRRVVAAEAVATTFAAVAREFIEGHKVKRSGKRPRRWREIARILGLDYPAEGDDPTVIKGGLAERWRDRPIVEITGDDIDGVIVESRDDGIPGLPPRNSDASDARGRKMADALGAMFGKWIMRHRGRYRVAANPCVGVYRPGAPAARDRVLNCKADVRRADELRWFWSATDSAGEPAGALLKLLLLTGCRLNEISEMRWDELSDDLAMLRLPGERTKNGLPHEVPLPPLAHELLQKVKRIERCPYVFTTTGRSPVSGWSKLKKKLDAAMLAAAKRERGKLPPWRLHDLRRSCSTGMNGIGIAPHVVEACLNHISGAKAGVAGTYNQEQYAKEKRAALEQWAGHVERLVSGQDAKVLTLTRV